MHGKSTKRRTNMTAASLTAVVLATGIIASFAVTEARAGFPAPPGLPSPPSVNINVSGGVPAPPGVYIPSEDRRGYKNEGRHGNRKHEGRKQGHKKHKKHKKHG